MPSEFHVTVPYLLSFVMGMPPSLFQSASTKQLLTFFSLLHKKVSLECS